MHCALCSEGDLCSLLAEASCCPGSAMSFAFGFGGGTPSPSTAEAAKPQPFDAVSHPFGDGAPLHYDAGCVASKRPPPLSSSDGDHAPASQRRRTVVPDTPPDNPPPPPGRTWPRWYPPLAPNAAVKQFTLEGRRYCYRRGTAGKARIWAVLSDGSVGPAVGWRRQGGEMSIEPGEWAGELLDASPLDHTTSLADHATQAAAVLPPSVHAAACDGIRAVSCGDAWVLPSAVDSATITEARLEVEELLRAGKFLRRSNHGQQSNVRDDKVGFFPLRRGAHESNTALPAEHGLGHDEDQCACPPALARCFNILIELACLDGISQAVTGGGAPLLLPPVGMVAVYDGNRSKYVAHLDNEMVVGESGSWQWRNARVLTAIMCVLPHTSRVVVLRNATFGLVESAS